MHASATEVLPEPAPPGKLRSLSELPGPRGWPLVGNLLQLDRQRAHQTVERWARRFGPVFQITLGPTRFLVVAEHHAIAGMLRDRPDGFRRPPRLEVIWNEMGLAPGVFGANGDAWRRQRRMVMAGFDPGHVRAYFPALVRVTQRLRSRWQTAARTGTHIDLQADLMRFTVDAIAGLAFGREMHTLESDEDLIQRHLDKIFPAVARRMLAPFPYWRYLRLPSDRRLESDVHAVNAAVQGFITDARQRLHHQPVLREQPTNLLEAMIASADLPHSGVDDRDVAGNVLTMLLAGEDTTANTLAWMFHLMHANPATLRRATDEVDAVMRKVGAAPGDLTMSGIDQLDYIEACIHETMRLKPVGPLNVVQALRDTAVAGVHVPRGTMVWCVMRHDTVLERNFACPAQFEPQRWLEGKDGNAAASAAKRVSMPFGAGPRVCPGRYLALQEMKMVAAMFLSQFEIEMLAPIGGGVTREQLAFTMAPVGLQMRLRRRDAGLSVGTEQMKPEAR